MRSEDKLRRFIISYRLSDDMVTVYEKAQRNSGIIGGKFLERTRVCKPGSLVDSPDFYTPADFSIGAVVEIFKHRFKITDVDEYVLKYLESFPGKFPAATIDSIRAKLGKTTTPVEESSGNNNNGKDIKTESQWRWVLLFKVSSLLQKRNSEASFKKYSIFIWKQSITFLL